MLVTDSEPGEEYTLFSFCLEDSLVWDIISRMRILPQNKTLNHVLNILLSNTIRWTPRHESPEEFAMHVQQDLDNSKSEELDFLVWFIVTLSYRGENMCISKWLGLLKHFGKKKSGIWINRLWIIEIPLYMKKILENHFSRAIDSWWNKFGKGTILNKKMETYQCQG